jgi:hypothetical protein
MIYSFILFTIPTILQIYNISLSLNKSETFTAYITLLILIINFYVISIVFLLLAGMTDPGIFERKKVIHKFINLDKPIQIL